MAENEFRLSFRECSRTLRARLEEDPPTRIQLLSGPRQVGKTTLLLELEREWSGRALYLASDAPVASLPGAWDRAVSEAERRSQEGPFLLLLDEVAHLPGWASRLEEICDRVLRQLCARSIAPHELPETPDPGVERVSLTSTGLWSEIQVVSTR